MIALEKKTRVSKGFHKFFRATCPICIEPVAANHYHRRHRIKLGKFFSSGPHVGGAMVYTCWRCASRHVGHDQAVLHVLTDHMTPPWGWRKPAQTSQPADNAPTELPQPGAQARPPVEVPGTPPESKGLQALGGELEAKAAEMAELARAITEKIRQLVA